jgi:cytochrome c peroxidase
MISNAMRRFARSEARTAPIALAMVALLISAACGASAAHALTAAEDKEIDRGSHVFFKARFRGNGRSCGSCHLQQFDINLSPANIATLNSHQKNLALATHNPALENAALVKTLGLFNINDDLVGPPGNINAPAGPVRVSMALGGLKFTTLNLCRNSGIISSITSDSTGLATVTLVEPMELFVGEGVQITGTSDFDNDAPFSQVKSLILPSSNSGVLSTTQFTFQSAVNSTTDSVANGNVNAGANVKGIGVCPGAAINNKNAVDDGNRNIELGWSGNGAPMDPEPRHPELKAARDCITAIEDFEANPTDLFRALRAFAVGAVRHHLPKSQNRVPGVDFRCPTSGELDAVADFMINLGRQFELALCANSNPPAICTGTAVDFSGEGDAASNSTGLNGTQVPKFSQNVSSLAVPVTNPAGAPLGNVITFRDDTGGTELTNNTAELGKAIFLDSRASCNLCHLNGGAQSTTGEIKGEPFAKDSLGNAVSPFNTATTWAASTTYADASGPTEAAKRATNRWSVVTPTAAFPNNPFFFLALDTIPPADGGDADDFTGISSATEPNWDAAPNLEDTVADGGITWLNFGIAAQRLNSPGRNFSTETETDRARDNAATISGFTTSALSSTPLNSLVSPIQIPFDPADEILVGDNGNLPVEFNEGAFNIQSIIEAARKSTFFHNGVVLTRIEDAAAFYFSNIFDNAIANPRSDTGANELAALAATFIGGTTDADKQAVLNDLGFFLRALSVVYSLADCERLVQDTIDRVNLGLSSGVTVAACTTNLNDVSRVILGAMVALPPQYSNVQSSTATLVKKLHTAARTKNKAALGEILSNLRILRRSIATISFSSDGDPLCTGGSAAAGC